MATYGIKAKYSPFSFNELMAPLKMYKEEYDKVSENLLSLGEEAGALQQYLDPNSESGQAVQAYNDALNGLASDFSSNGLKAVSRNALYNLRRQYSGQIAKIKAATTTYQSMQDSIRKEAIKDPTLMVGYMPTVDDLVRDPSATPTMVSGNTVYKQAIQAAQSASSRIFSSEMGRKMYGYIEQMQRTGYSDAQIKNFIAGNLDAIPELREAYNNIASMYGTDTLSDPSKANDFILQGLYDGLAVSQKSNWVQDWQAKAATEDFYARRRQREQAALQDQKNSGTKKGSKLTQVDTTSMIFERDRDTAVNKFFDKKTGTLLLDDSMFKDNKFVRPESTYKQLVTATGMPMTTDDGQPLMYETNSSSRKQYDELREFLGKYYSDKEIDSMNKAQVEAALRNIYNDSNMDVQGAEQYRWKLNAGSTESIIQTLNNGYKVREITDRKSDGGFEYGKREPLKYKKDVSGEIRYDVASNSLILRYDGKYYEVPRGILGNDTIESLDSIALPKSGSGLSELRETQLNIDDIEAALSAVGLDTQEKMQAFYSNAVQKAQSGQISDAELKIAQTIGAYFENLNRLSEMDSIMGNVGYELNSYVGTRNLNTN